MTHIDWMKRRMRHVHLVRAGCWSQTQHCDECRSNWPILAQSLDISKALENRKYVLLGRKSQNWSEEHSFYSIFPFCLKWTTSVAFAFLERKCIGKTPGNSILDLTVKVLKRFLWGKWGKWGTERPNSWPKSLRRIRIRAGVPTCISPLPWHWLMTWWINDTR